MKKDNLIPNEFFITKGTGLSMLELHAGSFHYALHDAGISDYNIMTYSSVLPATAKLVSKDDVDMPVYGSELKCIQAVAHGEFGQHIAAGIAYAWMYSDEEFTNKIGGLVTEVNGFYSIENLENRLYTVLEDLYNGTYKDRGYYLGEVNIITQGLDIPNDVRYGTALVSMCFINYL